MIEKYFYIQMYTIYTMYTMNNVVLNQNLLVFFKVFFGLSSFILTG